MAHQDADVLRQAREPVVVAMRLLLHEDGALLVGAPVCVAARRRCVHDLVRVEVRREDANPHLERVDVVAAFRPVVRVFAVAADDLRLGCGRLADHADSARRASERHCLRIEQNPTRAASRRPRRRADSPETKAAGHVGVGAGRQRKVHTTKLQLARRITKRARRRRL